MNLSKKILCLTLIFIISFSVFIDSKKEADAFVGVATGAAIVAVASLLIIAGYKFSSAMDMERAATFTYNNMTSTQKAIIENKVTTSEMLANGLKFAVWTRNEILESFNWFINDFIGTEPNKFEDGIGLYTTVDTFPNTSSSISSKLPVHKTLAVEEDSVVSFGTTEFYITRDGSSVNFVVDTASTFSLSGYNQINIFPTISSLKLKIHMPCVSYEKGYPEIRFYMSSDYNSSPDYQSWFWGINGYKYNGKSITQESGRTFYLDDNNTKVYIDNNYITYSFDNYLFMLLTDGLGIIQPRLSYSYDESTAIGVNDYLGGLNEDSQVGVYIPDNCNGLLNQGTSDILGTVNNGVFTGADVLNPTIPDVGENATVETNVQTIAQALTQAFTIDLAVPFTNFINVFKFKIEPIYLNFSNTINSLSYQDYQFEDIKAYLYGQERVVVKLSLINPYLPTAKQWFAGIFWIFYAFYVYDQLYFLIRGTHALSMSIASSNINYNSQNRSSKGGK